MADRNLIVSGKRAALGMLRREHLPAFASWFNDPEVRRGLAHRGLVNVEAEEKWFEAMTEAGYASRPETVAFAVHAADDGELVVACSLEQIDHNFLRCEFGIFLGRRRGEGIGSDAVRLVLDSRAGAAPLGGRGLGAPRPWSPATAAITSHRPSSCRSGLPTGASGQPPWRSPQSRRPP